MVTEKVRENNNKVEVEVGRAHRTHHANMLRKYWDRESTDVHQQSVSRCDTVRQQNFNTKGLR